MSETDATDGETDLTVAFDPDTDDPRPVDARGATRDDEGSEQAWKVSCRECSELVPSKPYCYECGAERPADGNYYVEG